MPYDLAVEPSLPAVLPRPLAFALQKLDEVVAAASALKALDAGTGAAPEPLELSTFTGAPAPARRQLDAALLDRPEPYGERRPKQPQFAAFPTTTIGSFPQVQYGACSCNMVLFSCSYCSAGP